MSAMDDIRKKEARVEKLPPLELALFILWDLPDGYESVATDAADEYKALVDALHEAQQNEKDEHHIRLGLEEQLAARDAAIEAAREALKHVQSIRGLKVDRVVYEALAALEQVAK